MGFASWLRYCTDVAQPRSTKLCAMFGRLLRCYIIFGLLFSNEILQGAGAKFTLRPSLAFSYICRVTARHSSSGRQRNCDVVEGMELQNFCKGRHIYSARRPSHWASDHIPVSSILCLYDNNRLQLTRMWADAQRDRRPAEYRWRPSAERRKV